MEYRNLGRTGVQVSRLCLGCMMFGWKTSEEDSFKVIDRALDAGINFLDTANIYGRGSSEEVVGKALKRNGKRDRIVLATKVHFRMDDKDPNAYGNSRRHIIEQCEQSLKRLQTDRIDLYQIHRPMSEIPIDETLRALDDLVRSGKVRYLGTTTFGAWQIVESLWVSKELGLNRFVTDQPPYNILDRRIERELIPAAQSYGLGLIPWSPLAAGFLTGKYRKGEARPADARLQQENEWYNRHFTDEAFNLAEQIVEYAKKKGCTPSQFALSWCLHQKGITSPIIGPRTMDQFEDNLRALEISLTDEDRAFVDRIAPSGRVTIDYYEADFGPSAYRW
ncbi:MAG: aldo/keto reductase [Ignavibacteriales bacterium]|nr:aldo/keto reductase [Ignavibacteriales bacterium]